MIVSLGIPKNSFGSIFSFIFEINLLRSVSCHSFCEDLPLSAMSHACVRHSPISFIEKTTFEGKILSLLNERTEKVPFGDDGTV